MNGRMKLARTIPEAVVTWAVWGPSRSETHNCGNFVFSYFISLQVLVLYRVRPPQPNLSTCRWVVDDVLSLRFPLCSFFHHHHHHHHFLLVLLAMLIPWVVLHESIFDRARCAKRVFKSGVRHIYLHIHMCVHTRPHR